jgi:ABC-type nitrate/sulfonate/bicarbonate transport system permease component
MTAITPAGDAGRTGSLGVDPLDLAHTDPTTGARITAAADAPSAAGQTALRVLKAVTSAVLSFVIILLAWQAIVSGFHLQTFIARGPLDVWSYLTDPTNTAERTLLLDASRTTMRDAAIGLLFGTLAAVVVAMVFTMRRGVEQALMPVAMTLRTVPLVAMTPLIALIFGRGVMAVTVIAGIVTFFPTLVNVSLALRSVPVQSIDLMKAYGASPWTTLTKVQFPAALPSLFASLRIAAPLALVGALLAEWLATGQGLGYLMLQSVSTFQTNRLWATVAIVTFASIILYNVITAIENSVLARYAPGSDRASVV